MLNHPMKNNLLRIESSYFVAGAIMRRSTCHSCAPIIKYMKGWSSKKIINYCIKKGWKYQ